MNMEVSDALLCELHRFDAADQQVLMHNWPAARRIMEARRNQAAVAACRELMGLIRAAAEAEYDARQGVLFN